MKHLNRILGLALIPISFWACKKQEEPPKETLFQKIEAVDSGIDFRNDLAFDEKFNIFTYRNFYNGGGVALGDVNNDGLLDVYLTAQPKRQPPVPQQRQFQVSGCDGDCGRGGYKGLEYGRGHGRRQR
jgi:enediyne biosynthesis protein E4